MPLTRPRSSQRARFIICGSDALALRLAEEFQRLNEPFAVIVENVLDPFAMRISQMGVRIIEGPKRDVETLRAAGIKHAEALALTESDDVGNVHAALAAQELNPALRLVVRMYNRRLTARIDALFDQCTVLSPSAIAAPAFVNAALGDGGGQRFRIAGKLLTVGTRTAVNEVLVSLTRRSNKTHHELELLPSAADPTDLVLGTPLDNDGEPAQLSAPATTNPQNNIAQRPHVRRRVRWQRLTGFIAAILSFRLRLLISVLIALTVTATMVFHFAWQLRWVDAFYRTITVVTATGYDNLLGSDAPAGMKLFSAGVVMAGVFLFAVLTAIVVDDLISARLGQRLSLSVGKPKNHVVVCGLGRVGLHVVEHLVQARMTVVAIDRTPDNARMALARKLGVAVVHGDTSKEDTLNAASVQTARCVVAVTDNDVTNLEAGLAARALRPDMPVVLRLFDADLAKRVDRRLGLTTSRSVSYVAAPVFAAAMLGREVLQVLPYGRRMLMLAELPVADDSAIIGRPLESLENEGELRIIALQRGFNVNWQPLGSMVLTSQDRLIVAVTRAGLTRALQATRSPGESI